MRYKMDPNKLVMLLVSMPKVGDRVYYEDSEFGAPRRLLEYKTVRGSLFLRVGNVFKPKREVQKGEWEPARYIRKMRRDGYKGGYLERDPTTEEFRDYIKRTIKNDT